MDDAIKVAEHIPSDVTSLEAAGRLFDGYSRKTFGRR
jgi:hypothetical protein